MCIFVIFVRVQCVLMHHVYVDPSSNWRLEFGCSGMFRILVFGEVEFLEEYLTAYSIMRRLMNFGSVTNFQNFDRSFQVPGCYTNYKLQSYQERVEIK